MRRNSRWQRPSKTAIADRQMLIAEAGTGTGKTFAYLVPALISGKRVIVSTGTKTLQDQLFHRDLPQVRAVLGARVVGGDSQGPRELSLSAPARSGAARRPVREPRPGRAAASDPCLVGADTQRRSRGACRGCRGFAALAARHLDDRKLPRRGLSVLQRLLRRQGAARGAGSRSRRRQPSSSVCRSCDQAGRIRRNPARRARVHPRRSAPDSRACRPVFFGVAVRASTGRACRRCACRMRRHRRCAGVAASPGRCAEPRHQAAPACARSISGKGRDDADRDTMPMSTARLAALREALTALAETLGKHAERSRGLASVHERAETQAARLARSLRFGQPRFGALVRIQRARFRVPCDTARSLAAAARIARAKSCRVDLHVGDAFGRRPLRAFRAAARA